MGVSTGKGKTKKLDPKIERLLQLIVEARRASRLQRPAEAGSQA